MDLQNVLQSIGLNKKEARVYLTSLQLGEDSAFHIAKKSELKRSTTYIILNSLVEKGLVSILKTPKVTLYSPLAPRKLLTELSQKQETLLENLPALEGIYNFRPHKPKIQLFEGKTGIENIYQYVFDYLKTGKEILFYGAFDYLYHNDKLLALLDKWFVATKNKRCKIREILANWKTEDIYIKNIKKNKNSNHQIRLLPKSLLWTNDNIIYDNKLVILSLEKDLFVIVIESKPIVDSYRTMFEMSWQSAKRI